MHAIVQHLIDELRLVIPLQVMLLYVEHEVDEQIMYHIDVDDDDCLYYLILVVVDII
jgi:hypothetical protein